ncbi:hypothetical protein [Chitinophaga tropicalis]|uniref:Uncharacterized protein n=1 Tax=Chitinophaga tropicalis TaxID=2683588 RepID=A0A7K1TZZ4_9BACT|nr:hypothetical protein [Chitinophaga tropicalis]MVT07672.1 hypothetical protein [Chitinophaga tropicalis]
MKVQKIAMTGLLVMTGIAAFSMKGYRPIGDYIYGKVQGQCQALCGTTVSNICTVGSDDGKYYALINCTTQYLSIRYAKPGS